MNFLAHYLLAKRLRLPVESSSAYIIGTALPDLLPLAAPNKRLRLATLADAPGLPAGEAALTAGVRAHLLTDSAFHKTNSFQATQFRVGDLIMQAGFTDMRVRRFFLAHVLTELALDAVLLRRQPELAEGFYHAFVNSGHRAITHWTEVMVGQPLPALPGVLSRFTHSRYLVSYATDGGVAEGLSRVCLRARQDAFDDDNRTRLVGLVSESVALLADLADEMLDETAQAVAAKTPG